MTEQALLNKTVEELYVFREFIEEMRAHESQNQSSLFTAKFQAIENEIDYINNLIQNVQIVFGYAVTYPSGHPQPTLKPAGTQEEQNASELGLLKEFLWWLLPVQSEFHRETKA